MNTLLTHSIFDSWGTFIVLFFGGVIALYVARDAAHRAINGIFSVFYSGFRFASFSLFRARKQLAERNREVLLNLGREQTMRELEKEFFEINKFVQRDLGGYPELQRTMQDQIAKIQDDYERSGEVPLNSPEWLEAIKAVTKLKSSDAANAMNSQILEQIHQSAEKQHKDNLQAYRTENSSRHQILKAMTPYWRKLSNSVDDVGNRLQEIITRSNNIDTQMNRFNEIISGTDKAEQSLKMSAMTQFLIAALVIAVAAGGAFFNFHLIALPMSEMVGSVHRIGGVKVADLAALVIICLEVTAGIFLLEGLRITKLFPLINSMDDRIRRTIVICAAVVLVVLAGTESALAFMRDQIAADLSALRASLAGSDIVAEEPSGINLWIPLAANMILGFILPLALTMVAIPLEYLLQTGRTVLGSLVEIALNLIAVVLRIFAATFKHAGRFAISLYDVLIAAPLWIESIVLKSRHTTGEPAIDSGFIGKNKS